MDLKTRTKEFALRIIRLYIALPKTNEAKAIGDQLMASGTAVGANYHRAVRSRTKSEFASKIEASMQELEATIYWLELLIESEIFQESQLTKLLAEANELTTVLATFLKKVKPGENAQRVGAE